MKSILLNIFSNLNLLGFAVIKVQSCMYAFKRVRRIFAYVSCYSAKNQCYLHACVHFYLTKSTSVF